MISVLRIQYCIALSRFKRQEMQLGVKSKFSFGNVEDEEAGASTSRVNYG